MASSTRSSDLKGDLVEAGDIVIILPTLNEEANIGSLLYAIERELTGLRHTVCVIDDDSQDATREIVRAAHTDEEHRVHLLERPKVGIGSQRGSALKAGLDWALQDARISTFIEMDGDLSHRPEELRIGIQLVQAGGHNVAIASKYVRGSQVLNRPLRRRMVSRISSIAVGLVITRRIRDYSNGYRFYDRHAAEMVQRHRLRYASPIYLSEVLAIWLRSGMRVIEFPTTYIGRNEGISKLRYIDLAKAMIAAFEISLRFHLTEFELVERAPAPSAGVTQTG